MSQIEFDLVKLKQLGEIDVRSAIKNFSSYEQYFSELEKYVNESKYYLSDYTSDMIVIDTTERDNFRADLKKIKGVLMALGITYPLSTLTELDYEAERGNRTALADWLGKFHTEVAKMAGCISAAKMAVESPSEDTTSSAPLIEKPLILAADDKPELLTAVVNMLEDKFRVMAATSGSAVLRLMGKHPPELFLLDIEMPQMDGYELAEAIRKQKRFEQTPIIFLTSKNTREDVMSAIRRGGNDYLVKPVGKDLLVSKILQHLGLLGSM